MSLEEKLALKVTKSAIGNAIDEDAIKDAVRETELDVVEGVTGVISIATGGLLDLEEFGPLIVLGINHTIKYVVKKVINKMKEYAATSASGYVYKVKLQRVGVGNNVNYVTIHPYNAMMGPAVTFFNGENCQETSDTYTAFTCDEARINYASNQNFTY